MQAYYLKLELYPISHRGPERHNKRVDPEKYFEVVMSAAQIAEKKCKKESIL